MSTTTEDLTTKPCDDCGHPAPYHAITVPGKDGGTIDLLDGMPHRCDECAAKRRDQVATDERAAEAARMRDRWESTIPEEYRATDIDHEEFNRRVWLALRSHPFETEPLGLVGPPGRCKTRILALFARKAIAANLSIGWLNTFELVENLDARGYHKERAEAFKAFREWKRCRVLFLDDLGKTPWSARLESALFDLLEYRHGRGLVTHWSLNPQPEDVDQDPGDAAVLTAALDSEGIASKRNRFAPILSRLCNRTTIVPVR